MGDVQAVGDHLHRDRRRAGPRVVGQHDSLRVRADRVDGHRRGHPGVLPRRALRRHHHRPAASGVRAGVVWTARRFSVRRLDRNRRRRPLPRHLRSVLYAAARLCRVHTDVHGDGRRGRTPQMGSAVAALRHRRHRGGHRADRMAARTWSPQSTATPPTPARRSTTCPPTAQSCPSRCCSSRCSAGSA